MDVSNLGYAAGMASIGFMTFVVIAIVYMTLASTRNDNHSATVAE